MTQQTFRCMLFDLEEHLAIDSSLPQLYLLGTPSAQMRRGSQKVSWHATTQPIAVSPHTLARVSSSPDSSWPLTYRRWFLGCTDSTSNTLSRSVARVSVLEACTGWRFLRARLLLRSPAYTQTHAGCRHVSVVVATEKAAAQLCTALVAARGMQPQARDVINLHVWALGSLQSIWAIRQRCCWALLLTWSRCKGRLQLLLCDELHHELCPVIH